MSDPALQQPLDVVQDGGPSDDAGTLTPRQERGLTLLLCGRTQTEVAEELGLTRGAVWWWLHRDRVFAEAFERRAADLRRATLNEVAQGALEGVRHLRGVLNGTIKADPAQQRAAEILARPALGVGVEISVAPPRRAADPGAELADAEALLRGLLGGVGDGS